MAVFPESSELGAIRQHRHLLWQSEGGRQALSRES
jgi:hypothetical protein